MGKTRNLTPRRQLPSVFSSRSHYEGTTGHDEHDPWANILITGCGDELTHFTHDWLKDLRNAARKQPQPFHALVNVETDQEHEDRLVRLETEFASIRDMIAKRMRPLPSVKARFATLLVLWKSQRRHLSFIEKMAMCPAYQQIIGMGHDAVPLLLAEFEKKPGHYDWALRSITGDDPVPKESRGKLKEIAAAWIQWGHDNGYER